MKNEKMQDKWDFYYKHQFTTLEEGRITVHNDTNLPTTYYRKIIEKAGKNCKILNLEQDDILLEIGSGVGDVSKLMSKTVKHLYCCDVNQSLLLMAQMNCQDCNNISFHCNLQHQDSPLNFLSDNSVDKVVAEAVFVHCDTDVIIRYLEDIFRVLKPGGLLRTYYLVGEVVKDKPWLRMSDEKKILETIEKLGYNIMDKDHSAIKAHNYISKNQNSTVGLLLQKET